MLTLDDTGRIDPSPGEKQVPPGIEKITKDNR
jgi:hypothetical protein